MQAIQAIQATQPADTFDIHSLILQCSDCDRYWRSNKIERCIHCAREYGLPYFLDPLRRLALFQALQDIPVGTIMPFPGAPSEEDEENAMQFAIAMEDNCPWYDEKDPVCVQACWLALQEHCPWAELGDPQAQAKWEELLGLFQPVPVTPGQITYASLYFDMEFQECAHLADELDENPQEKWAAYCDKKDAEDKEKWEAYKEEKMDQYGL
jgi:hypothetical protein